MPNNSYLNFYYDKQADVTNYYLQPFTIHILEDQTRVSITGTCDFKYSWDDGLHWHTISLLNTTNTYIPAPHGANPTYFNNGDRIIIVGIGEGKINYNIKTNDKEFNVSGNIMSLYGGSIDYMNPDNFNDVSFRFELLKGSYVVDASKLILPVKVLASQYAYYNMFRECTHLKKAPELPATTLSQRCYHSMFYGCTSLEECPELPATTLNKYCYSYMFYGCTSLRMPCELPATTLAESCYSSMFQGCTSLLQMPNLNATILTGYCYYHMFNGCTSLTIPKELPATALESYCYYGMFWGCSSLMRAPDLDAAILPHNCYSNMFKNCTSLNYIQCLATQKQSDSLDNWVDNVAASGTFVKDVNARTNLDGPPYIWTIDNVSGIPIGWTLQNAGTPEVGGLTISVTTDPNDSGIIYGAGIYTLGDTCQLTASANNGYRFVGWYIGDSLLSANSIYSFTVSNSLNIKAKFEEYEITYYTVRWGKSNNNVINWSEVTQYAEGTEVTITAPAWPAVGGNYEVSGWYEKAPNEVEWTDLETDAQTYTFTVTQDIDIWIAYEFVEDTDANYIKLSASPRGYGQFNISFEGTSETTGEDKTYLILPGVQVTITAIPNVGYEFDYWQLNGINYSTATTVTFTPTQDFYLTAMFKDPDIDYRYEYFTIHSLEPDCGVWINIYKDEHFILQWSENYGQWREIELQYDGDNASYDEYNTLGPVQRYYNSKLIAILVTGGNVRLRCKRGILESANYASDEIGNPKVSRRFNITKKYVVSGNLYSLVDWEEGHVQYVEPTASIAIKDNAFAYMFYGDNKLVSSENLKLYNLNAGKRAFYSMFENCSIMTKTMSFIGTGRLDTTYGEYCLAYMFRRTPIAKAPLIQIGMAEGICYHMFYECEFLYNISEVRLNYTVAKNCYYGMFEECKSLNNVPSNLLPATTLAESCYENMFKACRNLQYAPELPATTLAKNCYSSMFNSCDKLMFAPLLPATTLAENCYYRMFDLCFNLCYIKILGTDTDYATKNSLKGWVGELMGDNSSWFTVASKGNFIKDSTMTYPLDNISGVPLGWTVYDSGATGEPTPEILNDKTLIKESSLQNLDEEDQWQFWYDDGTDAGYTDIVSTLTWGAEGATIDVVHGGHGYLPQINVLAEDENITLEQGHNYKIVLTCKISKGINQSFEDYTYNTINCLLGKDSMQMNQSFPVVDTNGQFVDIELNFPDYHNDMHEDPDDVVGPLAILRLAGFIGTITIKDVKLYEYGINAGETGTYYNISTQYDSTQGTVTGNGVYAANTTVTLTATPNTRYNFVNWIKDGVIVGTSTTLTITALENATYQAIFELDTEESSDYAYRYLTIEAIENDTVVYFGGLEINESAYGEAFTLYYSVEHGPWQSVNISAYTDDNYSNISTTPNGGYKYICTLYAGQSVRLHANATTLNTKSTPSGEYDRLSNRMFYVRKSSVLSSNDWYKKFNVYGNILSLVDADMIMPDNVNYDHPIQPDFSNVTLQGHGNFSRLFKWQRVVNASNLILPTTLRYSIFAYMFDNCKYLQYPPELNAPTLVAGCYDYMFMGCELLDNLTCLATQLPNSSSGTAYWLHEVSPTGTFFKATLMNDWTRDWEGIPEGWTVIDAN